MVKVINQKIINAKISTSAKQGRINAGKLFATTSSVLISANVVLALYYQQLRMNSKLALIKMNVISAPINVINIRNATTNVVATGGD